MEMQYRKVGELNFTIPEDIALCHLFSQQTSDNLDDPGKAGTQPYRGLNIVPFEEQVCKFKVVKIKSIPSARKEAQSVP